MKKLMLVMVIALVVFMVAPVHAKAAKKHGKKHHAVTTPVAPSTTLAPVKK
jgi:hypothetical protein